MIVSRNRFEQLPTIAQDPEKFDVLLSAQEFRTHLLAAIKNAQHRIYLVALYLEDDEAGREILTALYEAKQKNPELDINVCVDWHRAQRGLIGAEASEGNAAMYQEFAEQYTHSIPVYGVPVRGKEVFGVLHLKGFIIDEQVIYSGASLNNIYLNFKDRYRFDRYHVMHNPALANSMVDYICEQMIADQAVNDLALHNKPSTKQIKPAIRQLRASLARSDYTFKNQDIDNSQVGITPLVGIGKRRNLLNQSVIHLIAKAEDEIFICTPYFNFPYGISKEIRKALKRGVKITIVVGDKTANDFYIPPEEEFRTIGGLPYLYELNLRRFAKLNESHIASRNLSIRLWKHKDNSFHLKGLWIDKKFMLLTGNNLNPRAWKLDLENGLLIQDKHQHLMTKFDKECENIQQNTQLICTYKQLEKIEDYPLDVQKLLRKITRVKADKILKQIL